MELGTIFFIGFMAWLIYYSANESGGMGFSKIGNFIFALAILGVMVLVATTIE